MLAKAVTSENERYIIAKGGIGDKQTFSKGKVDKGKQIGKTMVLDTEKDAEKMTKTVEMVMQWMKKTLL